MIAVSMVWLLLLDPTNGYINKLLTLLHLPRRMWLFDTSLALGCLIAISVWKDSGYCMLVLLAGMQAIDTALYDAARVDGANAFGQMRHVTLPGLKPVLLFVSVNSCIAAFKTFEQVQTMTGGDPLYVWGDEFKVEEVITNYLTNALNHLDYDHTIEITCKKEGNVVKTTVFNTGDPIPEEDLDKVWVKFFKVDKARTREYGGSGIGLSIVKAIMDSFQQQCGCQNYDNGVAFWFTLEADGKTEEV